MNRWDEKHYYIFFERGVVCDWEDSPVLLEILAYKIMEIDTIQA